MRRGKFRRPCKVLIFNGARVLVAIVRSLHSAAELTHENKLAINNCCTGKSVRSGVYYYRQLHPESSDYSYRHKKKTAISCLYKSGKRGSNSRPQPWQGCALPTELFPQTFLRLRDFRLRSAKEQTLVHSLARKFRIITW